MGRLDLSPKNPQEQGTFLRRYKYFFGICNPITLLKSDAELNRAKDIVMRYRKGENIRNMSDDEIRGQKILFDSAFHPVTEQKMLAVGRMSAQCPLNTFIMTAMLVFYKTRAQVVFWQWVNQSANAVVNQVNSSDSTFNMKDAIKSYGMAVSVALGASVAINEVAGKMGTMAQRLVPFFAVSAANALNLPISRNKELREGIQLWYDGKEIGKSKKMAKEGIGMVILSRVIMQVPHMVFIPVAMSKLEPFFKKKPYLAVPFQLSVCAVFLLFSTPFGCSIFPQKVYVPVERLEAEVQEQLRRLPKPPKEVYYNKGL